MIQVFDDHLSACSNSLYPRFLTLLSKRREPSEELRELSDGDEVCALLLGFEFVAAKARANQEEEPVKEPMRGDRQVARNPSTDQRKIRNAQRRAQHDSNQPRTAAKTAPFFERKRRPNPTPVGFPSPSTACHFCNGHGKNAAEDRTCPSCNGSRHQTQVKSKLAAHTCPIDGSPMSLHNSGRGANYVCPRDGYTQQAADAKGAADPADLYQRAPGQPGGQDGRDADEERPYGPSGIEHSSAITRRARQLISQGDLK